MQITGIGSSTASNHTFIGTQGFKLNHKDMRERMHAQAREAKLRERENEMIKNLQEQIVAVEASDGKKEDKDATIELLSSQIKSIFDNRTKREQQAREAELQKQKEKLEEIKRKQEEANGEKRETEPVTDEDAIAKEDIEGMVKLAVSHDGLNALKKTKAGMASEARQLTQDLEHDVRNFTSRFDNTVMKKIQEMKEAEGGIQKKELDMAMGIQKQREKIEASNAPQEVKDAELEKLKGKIHEIFVGRQERIAALQKKEKEALETRGNIPGEVFSANTFKVRNLEKLNNGVENLNDTINTEVGKINKEANEIAKDKNEKAKETEKEETPEETEKSLLAGVAGV